MPPMALNVEKLKRGSIITNGIDVGVVAGIGYGHVLINWKNINPPPGPPIYYPEEVFRLQFGIGYRFVTEEEILSGLRGD